MLTPLGAVNRFAESKNVLRPRKGHLYKILLVSSVPNIPYWRLIIGKVELGFSLLVSLRVRLERERKKERELSEFCPEHEF